MAAKVAKPPKPPKAPKPAKKSSGGGGAGMKQLLLQKGERIGFIAAAALLVIFLGMGVMVAAKSPSTSQITGNIDSTIKGAKSKLTDPGSGPPELPSVVNEKPTLLAINFTDFRTPFPFFNEADVNNPKRMSPKILPATETMVEFVMGTAPAMETITDGSGKTLIAVLKNKQYSPADLSKVKGWRTRAGKAGAPKHRPTGGPPGMSPPGGVPGGVPGGPPGLPGGPPGLPGGSAAGGGGPPGVRGMISPPGGGPDSMGPGARTQEMQIEYIEIDSKDADKAMPAPALMPLRMVVVTGLLPYKKQLEEYARALKVNSFYYLDANDLPYYAGLDIERETLTLDGKEVVQDWQKLDIKETFGDIYARCLNWEPNEMFTSQDQWNEAPQEVRELAPYFSRIVPEMFQRLWLPRPKLMSGKYAAITLPSAVEALKEIKKNSTAPRIKSQQQRRFDREVDPFSDPNLGMGGMGMPGGRGDDAGMIGGGGRGDFNVPGGGGFRPGAPAPPGRPPGFPGGPGAPDSEMRTGPGQPGMPGTTGQALPEDAWMFRFIDASTEPGYAYRYRVKFKVHNPNLNRDPRELAISDLAKQEELESPWFVIKDLARSPQDEYLYAASDDKKANKVTEKLPPATGAQADETWLQVHKWFRDVRPKASTRADPIGDWLIADIKAVRGQYLADTPKIELPIWSMTQSKFVFREQAARGAAGVRRSAKEKRSWDIEMSPRIDGKEALVVDFEGGGGQHVANSKGRRVDDTASMDVLLMTEDGKLRLVRSTVDLANKERQDRVQYWTDWLAKIEQDTMLMQNQGQNPFAPGGDSGGGGARGDR